MKKIKLFALAAFAMLSTNVFAVDTVYEGVNYTSTSGDGSKATPYLLKVVSVKDPDAAVTTLSIPADFQKTDPVTDGQIYYRVTSFNAGWESAGKDVKATLTTLTIDITYMTAATALDNAFDALTALTSLTITDNAKNADDSWNPTAHNVTYLDLSAGVKKSLTTLAIGHTKIALSDGDFAVSANVFDKLTSITLPSTLTAIGAATDAAGVFAGFKGESITIPSGVSLIGKMAFEGSALKSVTFEADDKGKYSLETICNRVFKGSKALESISLPATVTQIGGLAFEGCEKLATATVPGELAGLGVSAFENCKILEAIDLSKAKITTLEDNVFKGCEKLATITLPETVTTIDAGALAGTIIEELNAPKVTTIDATAFGINDATRAENKALKTVVLGAAMIDDYTFYNCTALTSATIGFQDAANAIDAFAFGKCTSLTEFAWDCTSVTTSAATAQLNNDAFNGCTPNVVIKTSNLYKNKYTAPKFCIYAEAAARTFKTVADASGAAAAYGLIYDADNDLAVSAEDAKVYSVYVDADDAIAYFTALMPKSGKYYVPKGYHCILKTDEAKDEIPVTYEAALVNPAYDNVFTVTADTEYAAFLGNAGSGLNADNAANATFATRGNYLYRLSNNSSFGFSAYKKKLKAGSFFILLKTQPAAGRLQTVWLDENGNVEGDATAINSIVKKAQNAGVTYNLAGQKVNASYKGVVIKDGKKYIQK